MTILFSAKISKKHKDKLKKQFPEQSFTFCDSMDEAKAYLPEAKVLATYGVDVTADMVQKANKLKWIMVLSAGVEEMPLTAIEERGIRLTNARGIHKTPMAEYVFAMLLQVYRQTKTVIQNEVNHYWDEGTRMEELRGKTMLIVGAGAIGQEVARIGQAFRMKTIGISRSGQTKEYFDHNYPTSDLKRVLPEADIVVSVLPSTSETVYFYTADHFKQMADDAVFLNIGRGNAVAENVLLEAVRNGEISHAVLDVAEEEPLPQTNPMWDEERITITPHISGVSAQYVTRALDIFIQNLDTYLQNSSDFINIINPSRGY